MKNKTKKNIKAFTFIILSFVIGVFVGYLLTHPSKDLFKQQVIAYLVSERQRECKDVVIDPDGYVSYNTFILEYPENNSGTDKNGGNRIWIDCIKK